MFNFIKKIKNQILFVALTIVALILFWSWPENKSNYVTKTASQTAPKASIDTTVSSKKSSLKILDNGYHVFQTFNNCAPAALSMALSYFGINKSQEELATILRPYNNLSGKNDDKSTPPEELATQAENYGLIAYFRPGGDIEILKKFLDLDLPIIVRTLLYPDEDYAHYRVVKGYDEDKQEIIQDDSLEGKNLRFSYQEFLGLWKPFNYAYLIIAPIEKQSAIEKILGESLSWQTAWEKTLKKNLIDSDQNPNGFDENFNLAVTYYYLRQYSDSINVFEKIQNRLPKHTLWYQIEPLKSYFELGNFEKVFSLTDKIFQDGNRAASELYLLRGQSFLSQNKISEARAEFGKAVFYNINSTESQKNLESLSTLEQR